MEFPPEWEVFPAEDFNTAGPRAAGECGMELLAQMRPNGRVLDHYRVTLGGSRILDVKVPLAKLLLGHADSQMRLHFQIWPKDVLVRRNMMTSVWTDVYKMIAARDAAVESDEGVVLPHDAILEDLKSAGAAASIRYAVAIGEDLKLQLHLQSLPATAAYLAGKPLLRG